MVRVFVGAQTVLCALAEVVSMRFINGVGARPGIMGIDYSTAFWLYMYVNLVRFTKQYQHMSIIVLLWASYIIHVNQLFVGLGS